MTEATKPWIAKYWWFLAIGAVFVVLALTNPSQEIHRKAIQDWLSTPTVKSSEWLKAELSLVKSEGAIPFEFHNYLLFSTMTLGRHDDQKQISLGILHNPIITASELWDFSAIDADGRINLEWEEIRMERKPKRFFLDGTEVGLSISSQIQASRDADDIYLEYKKGRSDLHDVGCTISIKYRRKKHEDVEKREQWAIWKAGEKKKIDVMDARKVVEMSLCGGATRDGRRVMWVERSFTFDCSTIDDFRVRKNEGASAHDLHITYTGDDLLEDCTVAFTVYFDTNQRTVVERYWSSWKPSETKTLNISNSGNIQRALFKGTAKVDGEDVKLTYDAIWSQK